MVIETARDYVMLSWNKKDIKVRGFLSANRGKATIVKIELETADPHALSTLIHDLQEAQKPPPKKPAPPPPPKPLMLPAPRLQLEDKHHG